jgi:hypothetical protein
MARNRSPHQVTWRQLKDEGDLQERHVLMAIDLGLHAGSIVQEHAKAPDRGDLLLLEWVEDRFFAKHGQYVPGCDASPESQAEHPAENSLLVDPGTAISQMLSEHNIDEDDDRGYEMAGELIERLERETPVSYGEILEADQAMLRRQSEFRKAAVALTSVLARMPEVSEVRLFGSVALPLWKEVPRHARLRHRRIRTFHECANIDLAVWVTSPEIAPQIRKTCSQLVNDLNQQDIHLGIAHHTFSIHLLQQPGSRYLGMVCHYNQCPKGKPECQVPGCGTYRLVQVLPWFQLKPARLNEFNSQLLFKRPE